MKTTSRRMVTLVVLLATAGAMVSCFPNDPRTNTHFTSGSFDFPREGEYDPRGNGRQQPHNYDNNNNGWLVNKNRGRGNNWDPNSKFDGGVNARPVSNIQDHPSLNLDDIDNDNRVPVRNFGNNRNDRYNNNRYNHNNNIFGGAPMPGILPHQPTLLDAHLRPQLPRHEGNAQSGPTNPNQPLDVGPAFEGCERHPGPQNAEWMQEGHYQTIAQPMQHGSHIAVYPLTTLAPSYTLKITMPSVNYQVAIQGTHVRLEKCGTKRGRCEVQDEKATKSKDLLRPQTWNYFYSQVLPNQLTIGINEEVEVMSMNDIPTDELKEAEWLVMTGDGRSDDGSSHASGDGAFVAQYPCAEYVAAHMPTTPYPGRQPPSPNYNPTRPSYNPHAPGLHPNNPTMPGATHYNPFDPMDTRTDPHSHTHVNDTHTTQYLHTTDSPSFTDAVFHTTAAPEQEGGASAALIVGVIVAILIVILIVAIVLTVIKKQRSMTVNEGTPLSEQQTSAKQEQQQAK
ncbi:uncharacterized protein LOC108670234 [Hyalella azteca]|uniref:Uncharacterized protein LOC108670234 n=1 Tax=Hyalella azteca TaxID=294128 RepID=A0A8B7NHS3_HYAAZ|nr:uncharacterized protein LOC108670234 [Hyalella azteca]